MSGHIGDLAELYALGSLDEQERVTVERHVRACVECANRVREAEETMAFISDLEPHHDPPESIADRFAARLALSRGEQKALSRKVITTALIVGLVIFASIR
jgi:anti-sigma-K factor RskA